MKIYTETVSAQKNESAAIENGTLGIDYHKYHREAQMDIDARCEYPVSDITRLVLQTGPRRGFKYLIIETKDPTKNLKLSSRHRGLINQIIFLLKGTITIYKQTI